MIGGRHDMLVHIDTELQLSVVWCGSQSCPNVSERSISPSSGVYCEVTHYSIICIESGKNTLYDLYIS